MPTWLEGKISKVLADQHRREMVKAESPKLFDSVWAEVKGIADDAIASGYNIHFGGNQERRRITLGYNRFVSQPEAGTPTIQMFLLEDGSELQVTGDVSALPQFKIDVCPEDRVVCIKFNGKRVSPKEAAECIMGRLLFSLVPAASD